MIEREWERLRWPGRSRITRRFSWGFYSSRRALPSEFTAGQRSGSGGDSDARFEHESQHPTCQWDGRGSGRGGGDQQISMMVIGKTASCRSQGEGRKKMETMTAIKWIPPVGDRAKRYSSWAPGGLATGLLGGLRSR
jgi:hypothetical protein